MKLSKAQLLVLNEAKAKGYAQAVDWHPPVKKLLALGLIKPYEGINTYNNKWLLTEEGRKAVEK